MWRPYQKQDISKNSASTFFSIIADEATDATNNEQLFISARYLDHGFRTGNFLAFSGVLEKLPHMISSVSLLNGN